MNRPLILGLALGGIVLVALGVVLGMVLAGGDGDDTPASPSVTPGASETPTGNGTPTGTVTPSATASPSATVSPSPAPAPEFEWSILPPEAPRAGTVLYVEKGCYQCDGPTSAIERITFHDAGGGAVTPEIRTLFEAPGDANRYIASWWMAPDGTDMWAMVCSRGYCGGVGQETDDAQTTLHHSDDGGITWSELETFDGYVGIVHVSAGIPILVRTEVLGPGNVEATYFTLQGGVEVEAPEDSSPIFRDNGAEMRWQREDGAIVETDGTVLFASEERFTLSGTGHPTEDVFFISWANERPTDESRYALVDGGEVVAEFHGRAAANAQLYIGVGAWLSKVVAYGSATLGSGDVPGLSFDAGGLMPVMIDFTNGTLTPLTIYGPELGEAYRGRNRISAAVEDTELRGPVIVDAEGDCLNVRSEPALAASVVRCWADGVILTRTRVDTIEADGAEWLAVLGPDGSAGYASTEFLRK